MRDRIKSLRRVRAGDLEPHPSNWRRHPDRQRKALLDMLGDLGWCDAAVAYERENGELRLIDGHLRASLDPDARVPVLILDVTDAEAETLLASLDATTDMAGIDKSSLLRLLDGSQIESDVLRAQITRMVRGATVGEADDASNADVRTVQLFYDNEGFQQWQTAVKAICESGHATTPAEAVLHALRFYGE